MLKNIVISILVVIALVVGGTLFYLDSLVRSGVETAGSRVLGTQVAVAGVSLSPFSGNGALRGLTIANPEGFSVPYAFELGEVSMQLNTGSLFGEVIEIDFIRIDSPNINYENTLRTDNLRALLANIPDSGQTQTDDTGPGRELLIREFQLLSPRLNLVTPVASGPITIPDITLTDIGTTGSGGATPEEVIRTILARINRAIVEGNLPQVQEYRQRVQERLQEVETDARQRLEEAETEARDRVDEAVQDLGGRLQDILN
ncbi:MAG: hypothetical protein WD396_05240 [Pseudohongiellaceae bacterium]